MNTVTYIQLTQEQFDKLVNDVATKAADKAFKSGLEAANDRYISVKEAADILNTSTKKVYKDVKNNRYLNVLQNPLRILKSEILFQK